jgi:hypothetical protein
MAHKTYTKYGKPKGTVQAPVTASIYWEGDAKFMNEVSIFYIKLTGCVSYEVNAAV